MEGNNTGGNSYKGVGEERGIIPRAIERLFEQINHEKQFNNRLYSVRLEGRSEYLGFMHVHSDLPGAHI